MCIYTPGVIWYGYSQILPEYCNLSVRSLNAGDAPIPEQMILGIVGSERNPSIGADNQSFEILAIKLEIKRKLNDG